MAPAHKRELRELRVKVAQLPSGIKDVAELLQTEGGPAAYEAMIRNARPGPSWMIAHLDDVRGHDLTTTDGKAEACEDMVDALLRQPPIARAQYVRELAQRIEEPEAEVRRTLNEAMREREAHYTAHPEDRPKPAHVWERDAL